MRFYGLLALGLIGGTLAGVAAAIGVLMVLRALGAGEGPRGMLIAVFAVLAIAIGGALWVERRQASRNGPRNRA